LPTIVLIRVFPNIKLNTSCFIVTTMLILYCSPKCGMALTAKSASLPTDVIICTRANFSASGLAHIIVFRMASSFLTQRKRMVRSLVRLFKAIANPLGMFASLRPACTALGTTNISTVGKHPSCPHCLDDFPFQQQLKLAGTGAMGFGSGVEPLLKRSCSVSCHKVKSVAGVVCVAERSSGELQGT